MTTKGRATKIKQINRISSKLKTLCFKAQHQKVKTTHSHSGRRHSQSTHLTRGLCLEQVMNSYNSVAERHTTQQKMSKASEQTFLQRTHGDGQEANETMLSVISHQGNANQYQDEERLHTHQDG